MSVSLQNYFQLGIDSTNNPVNQSLQNTIITPVDTKSTHLNRVSFKVPKIGMLTSDSFVQVQFTNVAGVVANNSQGSVNLVNGALGAVKRFRLIMGNKVLTDLENPSLLATNDLYSQNTQQQLIDYHYFLMGNQFKTRATDIGVEEFSRDTRLRIDQTRTHFNMDKNQIGVATDSNVYALPLRHLGAAFLNSSALPVFLMGEREIVIELTFHSDCREYAIDSTGVIAAANTFGVNLDRVQLVSTHIMLNDALEQQERMAMAKKPIQYPLLDQYVVKASTGTTPAVDTALTNTYRINLQNRELHGICRVNKGLSPDGSNRVVANQASISLGDQKILVRSNGLNIFDRPVENDSLLYQLSTYYNHGNTLKIPFGAWSQNKQSLYITQTIPAAIGGNAVNTPLTQDYLGRFNYQGLDFENGNSNMVFGSGVVQKQTLEYEITLTPRTATHPKQNATQFEVLFYVSVSKLLTIGASNIQVSF
jgi:hypothetical protein